MISGCRQPARRSSRHPHLTRQGGKYAARVPKRCATHPAACSAQHTTQQPNPSSEDLANQLRTRPATQPLKELRSRLTSHAAPSSIIPQLHREQLLLVLLLVKEAGGLQPP